VVINLCVFGGLYIFSKTSTTPTVSSNERKMYGSLHPGENIKFEQGLDFYELKDIVYPPDRPYIWSMTVESFDGIIATSEVDASAGKDIALADFPGAKAGSFSDWYLVNVGWTLADAVLGSGAILRDEKETVFYSPYGDMQQYRLDHGKPKYPINVVLTGSGDIDLHHKMFKTADLHVVIATTPIGKANLLKRWPESFVAKQVDIEVLGSGDSPIIDQEGLVALVRLLKEKYNVNILDVTAGGKVISSLLWAKLVDEVHVTISGQVIGSYSTAGKPRPRFIDLEKEKSFTKDNSPLVQFKGVKVLPPHHIYVRGVYQYRH